LSRAQCSHIAAFINILGFFHMGRHTVRLIFLDRYKVALSVLDVHPFKGVDCDTDHGLVIGKARNKLSLNKQAVQREI
jgi:hypothetical protein